jgi:hypothetical protein
MRKLYTTIVLLCVACTIMAQTTTTWIGPATGGGWSDAGNWDNGVPTFSSIIVFDGGLIAGGSGTTTITDVLQSNINGSFAALRVVNGATVNLSGTLSSYLYLIDSFRVAPGCRLNIGGTSTARFDIGGDFSTKIFIEGILDLQGMGNSSNPANFFPTRNFLGNTVQCTVTGQVIVTGMNAKMLPNNSTPVFESGSQLTMKRNGGTVGKANYKNGSLIKVEGVTNLATSFSNDATYDGVIEWNCPLQTVSGSSAIILPTITFGYYDSLVINSTGVGRNVRLRTNPSNYYVKNLVVNAGTVELGSPNAGGFVGRFDNIFQNGGTIVGNAPGVAGFDNSFNPDTFYVAGNFTQVAGTFDFSTRMPVNANPDASCVLFVAGNLSMGGTVKLSQANNAKNCELNFNGLSDQTFTVGNNGIFSNKIKTVINNSFLLGGVQLGSKVTLPDSLLFKKGYIILNDFDLVNKYPVTLGSTDFTKHAITNGAGFFVQKNVKSDLIGLPIGASFSQFNPVSVNAMTDSVDFAARVETGITPAIVFPDRAVNRTWVLRATTPGSINRTLAIPNIMVGFGYSNIGPGLGDGNTAFSYTANNEVGMYDGSNWQVISAPGGVAPIGSNPYAVTQLFANGLLVENVATRCVVGNVTAVTPVNGVLNLQAIKQGTRAVLTWDVADAKDIAAFEILRSTDGRNFNSIGNNVAVLNQLLYSFTDNRMTIGTNYYRIKVKGIDGSYKYSLIAAVVNRTTGIQLTGLLPNLVKDNAVLMISSATPKNVSIVVADMQGKVMNRRTASIIAGSNQVQINCSNYAAGMFTIAVWADGELVGTTRMVKQ